MRKLIVGALSVLFMSQAFGQTPWTDRFSFKGDFRLRGDSATEETVVGGEVEDWERSRLRMRARLQMTAKVNENTDAIFRIASGGLSETDTTSTNQDLTDYGAKKGFNLDLAYANWKPNETAQVWLGKSPMVYYQPGNADMLFDSDVTPEGVSYKDTWKGETLSVFWNAGYWIVDEFSTNTGVTGKSAPEVTAVGGDLGINAKVGEFGVTLGGGIINFANIEGRPVATARGNTTTGTTAVYANKYELTRGFLEVTGPLLSNTVTLYYDYVQNEDPSDDNVGNLVGIRIGKLKNVADWAFSYDYRDVEADAALGVFAESDTGGGGTNLRVNRYTLGYQLAEATSAGLHYSQAERRATGRKLDYSRILLDLAYSF